MVRSRIVQCYVCDTEEVTKQALLPNGWLRTWDTTTTLCNSCLARWVERFKEEPAYWEKGGDEELMLL